MRVSFPTPITVRMRHRHMPLANEGIFRMHGPIMTPLPRHIPHIVCVCPQKKMVRPHTWAIIAVMATVQSGKDRSIRQFIGHAVSRDSAAVKTKRPIAAWVTGGSPQPAVISTGHVAPETFGRRFPRATLIVALRRTKLAFPFTYFVAPHHKDTLAHKADTGDTRTDVLAIALRRTKLALTSVYRGGLLSKRRRAHEAGT